jgi:hypothetical protein
VSSTRATEYTDSQLWHAISLDPVPAATLMLATIREPGRNVPVEAVNGRCTRCPYRMAWIVIRGKGEFGDKIRNASRT